MKAVQVLGTMDSPELVLNELMPKPTPLGSDVLVKVHASGITADELTWPELYNTPTRIPGHDISGIVDTLGPAYDGPLAVGDKVLAMLSANTGEGQAEYVLAKPSEIAAKPSSTSFEEAAVLPIPLLTAMEAIHRHAQLKKGGRALVTGASGAVGTMLVQIASKILGAEVVALASPSSHDRLRQLGAAETVDYNSPGWETAVQNVDAVFDTVGGDMLRKCWAVVKEDGKIVTVADPPPAWAFGRGKPEELVDHPKVGWVHFIVSADGEELAKACGWVEEGKLSPLGVKTFPMEEFAEAWRFAGSRSKGCKSAISFV